MQNFLYAKENRRPETHRTGERVDTVFLLLLLTLLTIGLIMLYSASSAQSMYDTGYVSATRYLVKQGICALIGIIAMVVLSRIPSDFWLRLSWPLYGVSIALLLSVLCSDSR